MTNIETTKNLLATKLAIKPAGMSILTPEHKLPSDVQADWLIYLLTKMYVSHGITKNPELVRRSIEENDCRLWFAIENDIPVACAALVKQSDGSVELGRGVSLSTPAGSIVMYSATLDHLQNNSTPLVAEVRVATEFEGIPTGLATQNICLHHLDLTPHALVPAFGHGLPFRQEPFIFATSKSPLESNPFFTPNDQAANLLLATTAIVLARSGILPNLKTQTSTHSSNLSKMEIVQTFPFSVLIPSVAGSTLETAISEAEKNSVFSLLPLETTSSNTSLIVAAFNSGFIPCGIDRNLGANGHPILLLGKLKAGTNLAPAEFSPKLPQAQSKPMQFINSLFR